MAKHRLGRGCARAYLGGVLPKHGSTSSGIPKWIKGKGPAFTNFHWQAGYGAFSVSESEADAVIDYIRCQEEHHRRMSFQEEYRRFLERYRIPYDERYVWD